MSNEPLRVALPMWTLVPAGMGGSETYARELIGELEVRDDVDVVVLVNRAGAGVLGASNERVARHVAGAPGTVGRVTTLARGAMSRAHRVELRDVDVVHYPFTVPVPGPAGRPWVQTLLDVQHLDLPGMFSRLERAYRLPTYDWSARRADHVVTISDFCKERIVHHLGIPADRITVAPLGVDTDAFHPHLGKREQFVLYPARAWPHKNHARLLEAMGLVRREWPELRLVLTGGMRDNLGSLPDWVEHRGQVARPALQDLMRRAACLVFPSLYEGFGLPALEAMASGLPVASSNAGALPEVCGNAAVLFDPTDVAAIASGIQQAVDQGSRLAELGLVRAREFTWSRCADMHVAAYARVAPLH